MCKLFLQRIHVRTRVYRRVLAEILRDFRHLGCLSLKDIRSGWIERKVKGGSSLLRSKIDILNSLSALNPKSA